MKSLLRFLSALYWAPMNAVVFSKSLLTTYHLHSQVNYADTSELNALCATTNALLERLGNRCFPTRLLLKRNLHVIKMELLRRKVQQSLLLQMQIALERESNK